MTAVDGKPTRMPEDLLATLRARDPGSTVTVCVRGPDGAARNARITLTDWPGVSR